MARLLQMLIPDTRRLRRAWIAYGLLGSMIALAGCILPPELPEYEEDQVPPYIVPREMTPSNRILTFTRAGVEEQPILSFDVTARDRNRHQRLYYVMLSTTRGIVQQGSETRSSQTLSEDGQIEFFNYNFTADIELCEEVPESRVETVTLYVADQELGTISPANPEPPRLIDFGSSNPTGHIVSTTWILEYTPDACTQVVPDE